MLPQGYKQGVRFGFTVLGIGIRVGCGLFRVLLRHILLARAFPPQALAWTFQLHMPLLPDLGPSPLPHP